MKYIILSPLQAVAGQVFTHPIPLDLHVRAGKLGNGLPIISGTTDNPKKRVDHQKMNNKNNSFR